MCVSGKQRCPPAPVFVSLSSCRSRYQVPPLCLLFPFYHVTASTGRGSALTDVDLGALVAFDGVVCGWKVCDRRISLRIAHSSTNAFTSCLSFVLKAFAELLWPTRCLICDRSGQLLCKSCYLKLPFIDQWDCCPDCGAPHGRVQCLYCNSMALGQLSEQGLEPLRCRSVISHDGQARRLVIGYKDQGERRLAEVMASMMEELLPTDATTHFDAICYIPASPSALRRRGFDHAHLLAESLSQKTGIPLVEAFARPHQKDQRGLDITDRFANMADALKLLPSFEVAEPLQSMLIIDDVYTTGATMFNAGAKLREHGVGSVEGLSFARA